MDMENLFIPVLAGALAALSFLVFVAPPAAAMSRIPGRTSPSVPDTGEGAACDLPPDVETLPGQGPAGDPGPPSLDLRSPERYETATFAMG